MADSSNVAPQENFGMTEQDIQRNKVKNILQIIKNYLVLIWPTISKILSTTIYYLIKFIKSFIKQSVEMIKGGGS